MLSPIVLVRGAPRLLAAFAGTAWCACVAYGFTQLARHELSPGESAAQARLAAAQAESRPLDERGRPALYLFAHPHCPCTRAALHELARIAAGRADELVIRVYVEELPELGQPHESSESWRIASAIPGVQVELDRGGRVARSFGARTSGQAVLLSARGELQFVGGLTRARGHAGDSAGARAVIDLLAGRSCATRSTPVYGCALERAASADSQGTSESR